MRTKIDPRVKPAGDGRRPGSSPAAIDLSLLEPGVVLQALSVGSRKVPLLLEAIEVGVECRVERGAVHLLNLIQESVWGDRSVARIQDGRADDPDRSSIGTVHGLVSFGAASAGFEVVVQLVGRFDDSRSIQAKSIPSRQGCEACPPSPAAVGGTSP